MSVSNGFQYTVENTGAGVFANGVTDQQGKLVSGSQGSVAFGYFDSDSAVTTAKSAADLLDNDWHVFGDSEGDSETTFYNNTPLNGSFSSQYDIPDLADFDTKNIYVVIGNASSLTASGEFFVYKFDATFDDSSFLPRVLNLDTATAGSILIGSLGPAQAISVAGTPSQPTLQMDSIVAPDNDGDGIPDSTDPKAPTGPGADAPANDITKKFQPASPNEPALRLAVPARESRTVIARGANGTEGIALIEFNLLSSPDSSGTAPLANLSTRGNIGTGDNILIAGVVIQGSGTKRVLVTGRGASVNVAGNIANTQLRVVNQATKDTIATSDDYASENQNVEIRAAGKAPTIVDNDAAVILDLPAGAYTVLVSGAGGATGIGIVEIFDIDPASSARIINLSTRGRVGTGDNVMIGGLIAGGKSGEFAGVITRVTSPSSAAYEPGKWLADPNITVFDGPNKVLENDNWTTP